MHGMTLDELRESHRKAAERLNRLEMQAAEYGGRNPAPLRLRCQLDEARITEREYRTWANKELTRQIWETSGIAAREQERRQEREQHIKDRLVAELTPPAPGEREYGPDGETMAEAALRLRRAVGLQQKDLAAFSSISAPTLSDLERGETRPKPATVRSLARTLEQFGRKDTGALWDYVRG